MNTMTSEFCLNNELMRAECVTLTVSAAASMIMRLITITCLPPSLSCDAWSLPARAPGILIRLCLAPGFDICNVKLIPESWSLIIFPQIYSWNKDYKRKTKQNLNLPSKESAKPPNKWETRVDPWALYLWHGVIMEHFLMLVNSYRWSRREKCFATFWILARAQTKWEW